jgi:hypothetical protein
MIKHNGTVVSTDTAPVNRSIDPFDVLCANSRYLNLDAVRSLLPSHGYNNDNDNDNDYDYDSEIP